MLSLIKLQERHWRGEEYRDWNCCRAYIGLRLQRDGTIGARQWPAASIEFFKLTWGYMISCPEIGQLVVVRKRPFVVAEIVPSATSPSHPNHLLNLSSVEDDGMGDEMEV